MNSEVPITRLNSTLLQELPVASDWNPNLHGTDIDPRLVLAITRIREDLQRLTQQVVQVSPDSPSSPDPQPPTTHLPELWLGGSDPVRLRSGRGSPENILAGIASHDIYFRTDGSANTTIYTKETGNGKTGWVAK